MSTTPPWSSEELATLRRLWAEGKTGGQIAKIMGRSRSAVLAKVNRIEGTDRRVLNGKPLVKKTPRIEKPKKTTPSLLTKPIRFDEIDLGRFKPRPERWTAIPRVVGTGHPCKLCGAARDCEHLRA